MPTCIEPRESRGERGRFLASVVFLRGVNVGRNKRFRPADLARRLSAFDVLNVGAAGTFVARAAVSPAALRAAVRRELPFEAEIMICRGRDLIALAAQETFADGAVPADAQRFVTVMAKNPRTTPPLPIAQPIGEDWQVKIVAIVGPFALTLWRLAGKRVLYPNEVVEKSFGGPATTRNWNTIRRVCKILEST